MTEYRWAVLGCGAIANQMARAMEKKGRRLWAVASRTPQKTEAFGKTYGIPKVYETIDELLMDKEIDIVYIATPHNTHIQYLRQAIKAGKHVLCEKSITLNLEELKEAVSLAKENHVVLAEAMTIYHMPLYRKLRSIADSGQLGKLKLIQMNFGSYKEYDENNRFFSPKLAGGAMLDIGVYALSFVRWFLSSKPDDILSQVNFAPTGVDEQSGILLKNQEGEMACVTLSLRAKQPKRGTIVYEKGYIEVYEYPRADKAVITYTEGSREEIVEAGEEADAMEYEIDHMEVAVGGEPGLMYLEHTEDVMDIMTAIRNQWGFRYPEERKE